ncbi:MAG: hypothetical protein ACRC9Y_16560 [Aeromonas veronii]
MRRIAETSILLFSVAATIIAFTWFSKEGGYEPIITGLFGVSGVIGSLISIFINVTPSTPKTDYGRQFDAVKARWYAEKNLNNPSYDEAKTLLSRSIEFLSLLRQSPISDSYFYEIDELISEAKSAYNHRIYLGRDCVESFWGQGSEVIERISQLANRV